MSPTRARELRVSIRHVGASLASMQMSAGGGYMGDRATLSMPETLHNFTAACGPHGAAAHD